MIGLLKQLTGETKEKRWSILPGKAASQALEGGGAPEEKAKSFCDPTSDVPCITVCTSKAGCGCNCQGVKQALQEAINESGLEITVGDAKFGCAGKCQNGPFVAFPQKGYFYQKVKPENAAEIVGQTLVNGRILFPFLSLSPDRSYKTDLYYEKDTGLLGAMTDKVCMVDVARYFLQFEEGLSCGKCVPCRIGMKRMQECVDRIIEGQGTVQDLEQIKTLCQTMKETPHCAFAMASSRPIESAVTRFEDEFKAHIERQECPAGVCKTLVELQRKKAIRQRLRSKKK